MANQSFAQGKVSIIAKDYESAKEVAELINSVTSYFTFYISFYFDDSVISLDDENRFECRLDGRGRWNFFNNIKYLGEWLDDYRNRTLKQGNAVSKLEFLGFELTFDYVDIREADGSIDKAVVKVTHVADTPIHSMTCRKVSYKRYQYSEKNLVKMTGSQTLFAQSFY